MTDVEHFLESPPLDVDIEEIRTALNAGNPHFQIQKEEERRAMLAHHSDRLGVSAEKVALRSAAVLIPIRQAMGGDGDLEVLFTQRALHMRNHPGQIAFPGGKHDPDDSSIQYTALRETLEEVGLAPDCFDLLGELGEYCSISGFCIKPIIAEMTRHSELSLSKDEVESVHWVPLAYLLNPANYRYKEKKIGGLTRGYFEVEYNKIRIWGVTAGILHGLYHTLRHSKMRN
ncbi:NUDIX hydrolase [Marinomonas balearica]|uniref:8-oxo-dGTP pyrophosphatase MutT (NUDIX family) n=1 Tax=Marinomonas balearica TaxID=491947 RepID=A0A4R6MAZ8_9GAMM|nr:CoA pyrophosphatase [Marinomonas balearica]TDO98741.1 8-oxo-dGTP pyrophosphatase MutT (NUDIX family) [Marinomonas balearica]